MSTHHGTALWGDDYRKKESMITFEPGVTSMQFTVQVYGDKIDELDEVYYGRRKSIHQKRAELKAKS